jgi:hypothetical protein
MTGYEKLIEELKAEYVDRKEISAPDWTQLTSWTGFVPDEVRKVWGEIPHEDQVLIYRIAEHARRHRP